MACRWFTGWRSRSAAPSIWSKVGDGTRAILWLPIAEADAAPTEAAPVAEQVPAHMARRTILAVDDDALVLLNTAALLEDLGHDVIEAESGSAALQFFKDRPDIDLVITDQAMPSMTGSDLIEAIKLIRPETPVIIASGYGEGVEVAGRSVIRLSKPFN